LKFLKKIFNALVLKLINWLYDIPQYWCSSDVSPSPQSNVPSQTQEWGIQRLVIEHENCDAKHDSHNPGFSSDLSSQSLSPSQTQNLDMHLLLSLHAKFSWGQVCFPTLKYITITLKK